uniref:C-type lectin domain family 17, member A-like n=1 Tax=Sinocyclocheilus rhinocerous TaxID=307959 RepID=A0A673JWZ2_9TELE
MDGQVLVCHLPGEEMAADALWEDGRPVEAVFQVFSHLTLCLWCSGSDCVKNRNSRAAAVWLVLLCVLLLTAIIVLCVHIHTKNTNYTEEKDQLLTKINNLTEERDQLLTKNINLTNERDGLLIKNDNLTKQREQFNQEINELVKSLHETGNLELYQYTITRNIVPELLFTDGWLYYKFSLYFISYERKSWTESRRFCTEKGADLIIINSREEQVMSKTLIQNILFFFNYGAFWIGLTGSDVEGRWKWVDGSTLTSGFDTYYNFKWICERKT